MTKKIIISLCSAVVIAAGAAICVSTMKANREPENPFFKRNLEVLTSGESTVKVPCVQATSVCEFVIQDANGKLYKGSIPGMKGEKE